jgi:hypothetical protein
MAGRFGFGARIASALATLFALARLKNTAWRPLVDTS